jgi:alkanesulfonate monooxygenase SsuD/methylene tetrahydromethanopterin reductase-like flavin-dependent oxidoreductase (luciferase family)
MGPLGHLAFRTITGRSSAIAWPTLDQYAAGRYQLGVGSARCLPIVRCSALRGLRLKPPDDLRVAGDYDKVWADGPSDFAGEFWSVGKPDSDLQGLGFHLTPYQDPHRNRYRRLTPGSANHKLAGRRAISGQPERDPSAAVTAKALGGRRRRRCKKWADARPPRLASGS